MENRLSVGIITSNRLEYLKEAIESVRSQKPFEIVVVVDGSSDGTKEYLASQPDISFEVFSSNQGRPAARNAVVKRMKGDALLWLDDDDALVKGAIAEYENALKNNTAADIIYTDLVNCDAILKPVSVAPVHNFEPDEILMHLVFQNIIPNGGTVIRKRVFDKVGLYDARFPRGQDYHFYMRAAASGVKYFHLQKQLYLVRMHAANLSNPLETRNQSKQQCEILKDMLKLCPIEKIFPRFNWTDSAHESAASALRIFSRVFFDHGDDVSALECVEQAESFAKTPEGGLMRGFILRSLKRDKDALETFAEITTHIAPSLAAMKVEVGAPRGSELVAANFLKGLKP